MADCGMKVNVRIKSKIDILSAFDVFSRLVLFFCDFSKELPRVQQQELKIVTCWGVKNCTETMGSNICNQSDKKAKAKRPSNITICSSSSLHERIPQSMNISFKSLSARFTLQVQIYSLSSVHDCLQIKQKKTKHSRVTNKAALQAVEQKKCFAKRHQKKYICSNAVLAPV